MKTLKRVYSRWEFLPRSIKKALAMPRFILFFDDNIVNCCCKDKIFNIENTAFFGYTEKNRNRGMIHKK